MPAPITTASTTAPASNPDNQPYFCVLICTCRTVTRGILWVFGSEFTERDALGIETRKPRIEEPVKFISDNEPVVNVRQDNSFGVCAPGKIVLFLILGERGLPVSDIFTLEGFPFGCVNPNLSSLLQDLRFPRCIYGPIVRKLVL